MKNRIIHFLWAGLVSCLATNAFAVTKWSVDTPCVQEISESYGMEQGLPDSIVLAIEILPDGTVIAATGKGLAVWQNKKWQKATYDPGFVVDKISANKQGLWMSGKERLACLRNGKWISLAMPEKTEITALCPYLESLFIGTPSGVWVTDGRTIKRIKNSPINVRALALFGGKLLVGARDGLYLSTAAAKDKNMSLTPMYPQDSHYSWLAREVKALAGGEKKFCFGSENGAGVFANSRWHLFTGMEGLPYDHFTCAGMVQDSVVWFGTEKGALRFDGRRWAYRASRRWLPNDYINDIAVAADGSAWLATNQGVGRITPLPMTLAEKALILQDIAEQRHTRMGYVVRCRLREAGNLETSWVDHTDNDGLYTAMYGAAQAFRYAITGDPEAKRKADQILDALKRLVEVTSIPGFPARAVVPADWQPNPNIALSPQVNAIIKEGDPLWKEIYPRWPTSQDGKYLWKCDTSSDEICGHYFFYAIYYDLVAKTEADQSAVRSLVRAITDHIITHGYTLVDYDNQPTRWANWSPAYVNGPEGWADRGLQSMEILSFLTVAWHITGDEKYLQAKKQLCQEHDYHINAISGRAVFPPNLVVPWDNNLAFLSYYGLLKYEKDPNLQKLWQASIERNWLFASRQNDPFFTFIYLAFKPEQASPILEATLPDLDQAYQKAVTTLQQTPLLLLGWEMKNSHRLDVVQDLTPGQRAGYGWLRSGDALPIDERCHIRINSDHFDLDHEQGGGNVEYEGSLFLLPFYLGWYHQLLQ